MTNTNKFPWGTVTKVHEIPGFPPIVEYIVGPHFDDAGKTNWQIESKVFVTMSYDTFHGALMGLLCDTYGEHGAESYVWRLIGSEPKRLP